MPIAQMSERYRDGAALGTESSEEGIAAMSKRFHEEGGEIYLPAAG